MNFFKKHVAPSAMAALLLLTFSPIVPTAKAAYADGENTWAAELIEKAGTYGLMEGYPDGRFGVGEDMTRAEFVTVLCRMMGWDLGNAVPESLFDCSGHWAEGYISAAAEQGAISLNGPFRPDDPISRGEMAEMLVCALGYETLARALDGTEVPFSDVSENTGFAAVAYDLGILTGVEENGQLKFLPTFSAPREQIAAMLVRCYERLYSGTYWLHGFYAFSSYAQLPYAAEMDTVSVGWARLEADENGVPLVNSTTKNGNEWNKPEQYALTTDYLTEKGIPYNLNVFGTASAFSSITEHGTTEDAISQLVETARDYAGLTLDVEGLRSEQRESYTAFVTALREALPQEKTLYVCVQPDTWYGGFDYRALGAVCDKVILMAHDYQWSEIPDYYLGTDKTYCPVTPISQIYTALQHITDPETGVEDKNKLALAISFNTTGFHVDENGLLLDRTFYHPTYTTIAKRLEQEDSRREWDEQSCNPNLYYTTEDGEHYRLWYEDEESVAAKLRLARMFGITGVSVWRLGTIPDCTGIENYNVWELLSQR